MFRKPVNQTGSAPATARLAVPGHWGYGNVLFLWSVNVYLSVSVLAVPVTMDNTLHLKVEYLIICIICDTDLVNKLILQVYTLHKYK